MIKEGALPTEKSTYTEVDDSLYRLCLEEDETVAHPPTARPCCPSEEHKVLTSEELPPKDIMEYNEECQVLCKD